VRFPAERIAVICMSLDSAWASGRINILCLVANCRVVLRIWLNDSRPGAAGAPEQTEPSDGPAAASSGRASD
jgi:hypothetical protein